MEFRPWAVLPLNNDRIALVDAEDMPRLRKYNWHVDPCGYGRTRITIGKGIHGHLKLHRFIMRVTDSTRPVHHINKIRLDCRKDNLIIFGTVKEHNEVHLQDMIERATRQRPLKNTKSGYKGVYPRSRSKHGSWRAQIALPGRNGVKHIGDFSVAEEAAHAYDRVAFEIWGEKAVLNFPKIP